MLVLRKKAGAIACLAAAAAATSIAVAPAASADTSARSTDIVGVGSDTVQNIVDFVLDGAPGVAGGYNSQGNNHRVFNFFATGDANGRATYDGTCGAAGSDGLGTFCSTTDDQQPNLLPSTVVLRAGTNPVTRPNGSGAGLAALTADASPGYQGLPEGSIQFSRASRAPKATEEAACDAITTCGGLHTFRIATDQLGIATVTTGFNGPAGLSINDLKNIFECTWTTWSQIPGYSGSAGSQTIHPLIPQSGSGTRSFFEADLGITDANLGNCVRVVEEHDPTGIYADPTPDNAVEPFSIGKIALINSGYFDNPGYTSVSEPQGAYTPGYLHILSGTADGNGTAGYNSSRGLFIVIRQADLNSTTPFQAGGTQNWAQTLFSTSTSWFAKSLNSGLFTAAGVTQAWKDCGNDMTENGDPDGC